MKSFNNLESFKSYIKTLSGEELNNVGYAIEQQLQKTRSPSLRLGRAMMIDAVTIEMCFRNNPVDEETLTMSDDELLAELAA